MDAETLAQRNRRVRNLLIAVGIALFVLSIVYVSFFHRPR